MILLPILFHAPLIVAAWLLASSLRDSTAEPSFAARARDTFLLALLGWRLEFLALGSVELRGPWTVAATHFLLLGLAVWIARRRRPAPPQSPRPSWSIDPMSAAVIGALLLAVAASAWLRIAALPDPFDSLTYHLMLPLRWFETGGLDLVPTYFGDLAPSYTPEAVESFFAALYFPLGDDTLGRIGQVPFLALGIHAVVRLIRRAHPTPSPSLLGNPALLGGAAFAFLPELFLQSSGSMVDVATAALYLTAVDLLLESRHSRTSAILAGATAGLFVASRFTSLVFLPTLLLPLCLGAGRAWSRWLWFGAGLIVFGAYPYVRNAFLTGNPVYPVQLALTESWVLPGLFTRAATEASHYHLATLSEALPILRDQFGISGLAWAAIGSLMPWIELVVRRRWHVGHVASILGLASVALHFIAVPYDANTRFLFAAWGCFVVATSSTMLNLTIGRWLLLALVGKSLYEFVPKIPELASRTAHRHSELYDVVTVEALALAVAITLGAALGWWIAERSRRVWTIVGILAIAGLIVGSEHARRVRANQWHTVVRSDPRIASLGPALDWIPKLPTGSTIAYAGRNVPYLVAGPTQQHRVLYIPLNGGPINAAPHELSPPDRPARTRGVVFRPDESGASRARWWLRLVEAKVDYFAVLDRHAIENDWLRRQPGAEVIAHGGDMTLYRLDY